MANESVVLPIKRGEDTLWTVTYKDENGSTVDLTGMTVEAHIKRAVTDSTSLTSLTGVILNQGTNEGQLTLSLSNAESLKLPVDMAADYSKNPKLYPCDVFLINGSNRECIIPAFIKVVPSTA
jgi:hypothetical protein